ncbi:MAG TPA: cache domain-containing protein [Burkholderiaceae bacterium]|jgi:signal transduction histidine kinase
MKAKIARYVSFFIAAMMVSLVANAQQRASADEAVAFVKKAVTYLKKHGKEKAYADFADLHNKQFHDRDLYIFVYDLKGICVAHGNNPKMVGKDLSQMKDANGKTIIQDFIELVNTKGSGWVEYSWPNPVTKNVEAKSSYIVKVDDILLGAGIYKASSK